MSKSAAVKKDDNGKDNAINLNDPKCSTYGSAKVSNPACTACLKSFEARHKACLALTAKAAETKTEKKVTGNHLDCFGCNVNEDTHRFVLEIYKNTHTMKAIKACSWNKNSSTFYCKANSLIERGLMLKNKKSKSYSLSSSGRKKLVKWIEGNKAQSKKAA